LALCFSHFHELTRSWVLFAEDNGGTLAGNLDGGGSDGQTNRTWAAGWLANSEFTPDNTNVLNLQNAQLGRYLLTSQAFVCPQDPSLSRGKTGQPRVRSVSMNAYMGERSAPYTSGYRQFKTLSAIVGPNPSDAYVFIEEHEGSINDGMFGVDMTGFDPDASRNRVLVDIPSDRHGGACPLSFADGHVEDWRWVDDRTRRAHSPGVLLPLNFASPGNDDVRRIQAASSSRTTRIPAQPLP
jgi:prepilin-type processing-associated H-X9-DG protein